MVIDWSKAPEGANGFVPGGGSRTPALWYRRDGQRLEWKPADGPGDWKQSVHPRDGIIWRDEQPAAWSGAGLPPVGAVCEVNYRDAWRVCEIIAHFEQGAGPVAAFTVAYADGNKSLDAFAEICFRPIKTPEQIAAEEREREIEALAADIRAQNHISGRVTAERLHSLGYRKTEGGAE